MKKNELLTWLGEQTWVQSVGEPVVVDAASGWQKVSIREVYGEVAINRIIHFYETPDGCYWKDSEPVKTLGNVENTTQYKMITFRTLLASTPLAAAIIAKIKAAANADTTGVLSEYVAMLSTYTVDGGIDINNASVQNMVNSMVGNGILTQAEADAVIALAD